MFENTCSSYHVLSGNAKPSALHPTAPPRRRVPSAFLPLPHKQAGGPAMEALQNPKRYRLKPALCRLPLRNGLRLKRARLKLGLCAGAKGKAYSRGASSPNRPQSKLQQAGRSEPNAPRLPKSPLAAEVPRSQATCAANPQKPCASFGTAALPAFQWPQREACAPLGAVAHESIAMREHIGAAALASPVVYHSGYASRFCRISAASKAQHQVRPYLF